ncbi:long-chain fatty acid--CoA ligase [bacterium]|nr:MAG: long-chain fatty acid--CoA ligase [bacterium]
MDALELQALSRPDKVALAEDGGPSYTYAALARESRRALAALKARGLRPGDRVALLAHNEAESVVLFFACRAGGLTLCPLNWRLAPPELAAILADYRPALLVSGSAFAADAALLAKGCDARLLSTADLAAARAEATDPGPLRRPPEPESVPLVLYTSGTTGRPKGAMLPNRMLDANAVHTLLGWGLGPEDSTVSAAPLFHTGGWNVMTLPLLSAGGTVTLTQKFCPERTAELMREGRATALFGVPAMLQTLLELDLGVKPKFLISGGAPCPAPLLERFLARGFNFKQGFGMTEVGPNCFCFPDRDVRRKRGSVGVPMAGTRMRLTDESGRERDEGELWVRGPHAFAGYLGRPEETAKTLVDGWVRTGDLASRDADGYYYVLGRKKEMFISGGENVYPVEVEAALQAHPGVLEAAVVGVPHERWGEAGRAFVVPRPGELLDPGALAAFLDGRLARYKQPKEILVRPSLPKNAMGKVLKGALS